MLMVLIGLEVRASTTVAVPAQLLPTNITSRRVLGADAGAGAAASADTPRPGSAVRNPVPRTAAASRAHSPVVRRTAWRLLVGNQVTQQRVSWPLATLPAVPRLPRDGSHRRRSDGQIGRASGRERVCQYV